MKSFIKITSFLPAVLEQQNVQILTLKDSRSLSVCGDFKLPEYKFKNTLSLSLCKCEYPIYAVLIMWFTDTFSPQIRILKTQTCIS